MENFTDRMFDIVHHYELRGKKESSTYQCKGWQLLRQIEIATHKLTKLEQRCNNGSVVVTAGFSVTDPATGEVIYESETYMYTIL